MNFCKFTAEQRKNVTEDHLRLVRESTVLFYRNRIMGKSVNRKSLLAREKRYLGKWSVFTFLSLPVSDLCRKSKVSPERCEQACCRKDFWIFLCSIVAVAELRVCCCLSHTGQWCPCGANWSKTSLSP